MLPYGHILVKVLSPRLIVKAMATIDKATATVVLSCWCAALLVFGFTVAAVHQAVSAKREAVDAAVAEPVLPVETTSVLNARDGEMILERLQHQFPDIKIEVDNSQAITIKATEGAKFHQWVSAISYIDTMEPQFRWSLFEFCVGHCGSDIMKAVITGKKVVFSLPQHS